MPYPETIKYIKKQIEKGVNTDKIKKALLESGYQQEVIDKLMDQAGVPKPEKKSSGIETILKDAAIGAVLLVIVGSFVYFNFFNQKTELFSPKSDLYVDFSKISPLNIAKNGYYELDLNKYVKDKKYDVNQIVWSYRNKFCINIQMSGNTAILRSLFLAGCPDEENIVFEAVNPDGKTTSGTLKIRIV